jgi:RNA polymerase sigma-70 factor (sigma-E family)
MQTWEEEYVEYVTARLPALRRLGYLLCGDESVADDLVQQTITALYLHWRKASNATHLDAYVRQMLVRAFIDEKRRPWSRVRVTDEPPERVAPAEPSVEDRMVLRAALRKVPRRQRAVLVLRFLCDLSVPEVAGLLRCSEGTVKSQTSHGLATLRRLLGAQTLAVLGNGR